MPPWIHVSSTVTYLGVLKTGSELSTPTRVRRLFETVDFVVTPTMGIAAFALNDIMPMDVGGKTAESFLDLILTTYAFSVTGLPAASVPCGFTADGMPVGLQIVGPRHRDDRVLAAAAAFVARRPEHNKRVLDTEFRQTG